VRALAALAPLVPLVLAACTPLPASPPREAPFRDVGLAPRDLPVVPLQQPPEVAAVQPVETETVPIDVQTCLRLAGSTSADVERARARLEVMRQLANRAQWSLLPEFVLGGSIRRNTGNIVGSEGGVSDPRFTVTSLGATLQYLINPGAAWYDRVAAFLRVEEAGARTEAERFDAEREAARLFVELDLRYAQVALTDELLRAARRQLEHLEQSVESGLLPPDAADDARLLGARREREKVEFENAARGASIRLAWHLRLNPRVTLVPPAPWLQPLALVDPELALDDLLRLAMARRPEARAAALGREAAEAEKTSATWRAWFPTLAISQSYGVIGRSHASDDLRGSDGLRPTETFLIGAAETLSGARFGDLEVSKALEEGAALEVELGGERIRAEVVGARTASRDALGTIARTRAEVDAAMRARAAAWNRYDLGLATGLDALVREELVAEARLRETAAVAAWNRAQLDLLYALGALGPAPAEADNASRTVP